MTTHPSEEVVVTLPDVKTLHDAGIVLRPRRVTEWPKPRVRPEPPRSLWGVEIGGWRDVASIVSMTVLLLVLFIGIPGLLWLGWGAGS